MQTVFIQPGTIRFEGSFDLSSAAAVLTLTNPDGSTKTVRGQFMSVAKNGTGTYDVTVKLATSLDGKPVWQPIEVIDADANMYGTGAMAGATGARISAVVADSNGNFKITVKTLSAAGADADTTAAITVMFHAVVVGQRMDGVI